ncbi:MAG: GerMN domain-containing protein [Eubacteriales bacterium]|jgi:hypothetical protein|nr:GerMN domain-containing protein [Eubacteriales bacterium]MDD4105710.1 GerMN domain-containing protein [Eubacteriales bacterium]MDD4710190.1 GerMN domain-containing protein [Eubacteriales bacterium]NLO14754.1 GerMN domain-containing protein [Clostridiales bacterium]
MKSKRPRIFCILGSVALLATACAPAVPNNSGAPAVTLPPALGKFQSPIGDEQRNAIETVLLYLPENGTGQLKALPVSIALPPNRHPAETAVQRLFSFSGNGSAAPLVTGGQLELFTGSSAEISGGTATINLSAAALALDAQQLASVSRAITNTLCQWQDIKFVNILVAGQHPGIDIAATLPMGSLRSTANEEPLWDIPAGEERFSSVATLYYPAPLGKGVLAEARAVTFSGRTLPEMATDLLTALSAAPVSLTNVPRIPSLEQLLASDIVVSDATTGGGRIVQLHFTQAANEMFINAGIPRSVMMASLVLTLTTFMPNTSGISVQIGSEIITALVPTGIFGAPGREILFEDGIMRRSQFSSFLLELSPIYFAGNEGSLTRVLRPLPYYQAHHARSLLAQMILGPGASEAVLGLKRTLPGSITDADLVGFAREGDTLLLNFSAAFLESCRGLTPEQEKLLIYSIVNGMCEMRGIRRVRFFIAGQQPETLSGSLYLPGEFLPQWEMLR